MEELLGQIKGVPAGTLWAISAFFFVTVLRAAQPAFSKWLESRAEGSRINGASKLNGTLVEAVQNALSSPAALELIDARVAQGAKVRERRIQDLEDWRRDHESEVKDALRRMAGLENAVETLSRIAERLEDRFDDRFTRLEEKLAEWLAEAKARQIETMQRLTKSERDDFK